MQRLRELEEMYPHESKEIEQKLKDMHENVEPQRMNKRIGMRHNNNS